MHSGTCDTPRAAKIRGENASRGGGNRGRNNVDEMVKLMNTTYNLHERLRNITREIIFEGCRMVVSALSKYLNAKYNGRFVRQIKYFAAKSKPGNMLFHVVMQFPYFLKARHYSYLST